MHGVIFGESSPGVAPPAPRFDPPFKDERASAKEP